MTDQGGARRTKCRACGCPVLCQRVGRIAALDVTADAKPVTAEEEPLLTGVNRLSWCLITGQWRPPELRWRNREHTPKCKHQIVIDHQCTRPTAQHTASTEQSALF